jgi:predicted dehydrogenase
MSEPVRVGIVGTSWWADMMYLPSLQSHPRAETVAICGRNRERGEEMAQKYAIPHVFTDYRELIEKGGVQALVVATPDDLHYPVTMAALDAGLHVLGEKPMALNAGHAREMCERAETVGVKHMIHFTSRWIPEYRYLKRLVDEGYLGRCFHGQFHHLAGYGLGGNYQWKWDPRRGLGILGDLGTHRIDLARWYCGEIASVSASLAAFVERPDSDGGIADSANDSALLTLQFVSGAQGSIQVSAVAHMADRLMEQRVTLHGEEGTLELVLYLGGGGELRGARSDAEQLEVLPIPDDFLVGVDPCSPPLEQWTQVFTRQAAGSRAFIDAILEDRPAAPDFRDGLKAQEVIDAAIEADRRGCWVKI